MIRIRTVLPGLVSALALAAGACSSTPDPVTPAKPATGGATYDAVPLIERDLLFGNPDKVAPQLSPDGAQLAYIAPDQGVLNVFVRAVGLREAVYGIFSALARQRTPGAGDLAGLNDELRRALIHQTVEPCGDGFDWAWEESAEALDPMLWPVARSAADLLVSAEAVQVRECAAPSCSWLFVDRSRSRRRKWCDMAVCGNRAKARRHYRRHRKVTSGS